jgi:hypothetical protein
MVNIVVLTFVFQVVLSVFWHRGMLGAAYYSVETSEVWFIILLSQLEKCKL